jgi:two-component system cell cycle sensor histidine kinase/response regulator CckA
VADSPLIAEADRNQLEQIIINLALNARDAMPDGGELRVSVDRAARADSQALGDVTIRVSDTGTGMPPEVMARAFEPFFTTKDRSQGSGLGLATVYGIARGNGGDAVIDSLEGVGTTVTVRLPGSALAPAAARTSASFITGGRDRLLLVEDEEPLRVATARLLRDYGYRVVVACDGMEALELLEARGDEIDVVVTDVVMSGMRGDELASRIAEQWPQLPIIFMSGHDSGVVAQAGQRLLDKPVHKEILLRALREALDA